MSLLVKRRHIQVNVEMKWNGIDFRQQHINAVKDWKREQPLFLFSSDKPKYNTL
jgi:hypothetical protein